MVAGQPGAGALANTLATVGALNALIEVLGSVSGTHINPAVSLVMAVRGAMPRASPLP